MSHYAAMVVVKNAEDAQQAIDISEDMLAPYSVSVKGDERFIPYSEWMIDSVVSVTRRMNRLKSENEGKVFVDDIDDKGLLDQVMKEWHEDEESEGILVDGQYGCMSTSNPNGKWNWHILGGRWSGMLTKKEGATTGSKNEEYRGDSFFSANENGVDVVQVKDLDRDDLMEKIGTIYALLNEDGWTDYRIEDRFGVFNFEMEEETWYEFMREYIGNLDDESWILLYYLRA